MAKPKVAKHKAPKAPAVGRGSARGKRAESGDAEGATGPAAELMEPLAEYDLEERTFVFAQRVRAFIRGLGRTLGNVEYARQLIRSSGSVGANYIEANEALGQKDFVMHVKICRKEAKESRYWLRLLDLAPTPGLDGERAALVAEAMELTLIFSAICRNREGQRNQGR